LPPMTLQLCSVKMSNLEVFSGALWDLTKSMEPIEFSTRHCQSRVLPVLRLVPLVLVQLRSLRCSSLITFSLPSIRSSMRLPNSGTGPVTSSIAASLQLDPLVVLSVTAPSTTVSHPKLTLLTLPALLSLCPVPPFRLKDCSCLAFVATTLAYSLNLKFFTESPKKTCQLKTTKFPLVKLKLCKKVLTLRLSPTVCN
jgi:hypothetical protein